LPATPSRRLRSKVTIHSSVLRDGQPRPCLPKVVQGDVVLLSAGSLIPADCVVLESKDFFVNQAVLTGETFPVEKRPGSVADNSSWPSAATACSWAPA
jgi:Mg2+-importing ATPase